MCLQYIDPNGENIINPTTGVILTDACIRVLDPVMYSPIQHQVTFKLGYYAGEQAYIEGKQPFTTMELTVEGAEFDLNFSEEEQMMENISLIFQILRYCNTKEGLGLEDYTIRS